MPIRNGRWPIVILGALLSAIVLLFAPGPQAHAGTNFAAPTQGPRAHAAIVVVPRPTSVYKRFALKWAEVRYEMRQPERKEMAKSYAKKAVKKLAKKLVKDARDGSDGECPDPFPFTYFCREPQAQWGRGMALRIGNDIPGQFRSPWIIEDARRALAPGVFFWLTCFTYGRTVDNGVNRTALWYRLTNNLYASDAWLYTGTDDPLPGVARC